MSKNFRKKGGGPVSVEEYKEARQLGQKEFRACVARGEYPYLQVLDETLRHADILREEPLGLVDIPMEKLVGTKTEGRRDAFARNFMPLLDTDSEFAAKWSALCRAHLGEGIREPITAYEFMNRFYVLEGNKRVSVLKYFGAASVPGTVRRLVPRRQDTVESRIYYDFLDFYRRAGANYIWFSRPGRFQKFDQLMTGGEERPWTEKERQEAASLYAAFRKEFHGLGGDKLPGTTGDALLALLQLHSPADLKAMGSDALRETLRKSWRELAAFSADEPVELELDPADPERSLLDRIMPGRPEPVRALFLYDKSTATSGWAHAHEEGRLAAQAELADEVTTWGRDDVKPREAEEVIAEEIGKGANVVFTTSPKLLPACIKAAVRFPAVKFLNCSVYTSHPTIRTYYGRMYEVKFLSGLIAGALSQTHRIGYIADYPIYGAAAAVNAFALGARMVDPGAQVCLVWRARGEDDLWNKLVAQGVDMISGQDLRSPVDPWRAYGLYRLEGSVGRQIAAATWNWGVFYHRILRGILDGEWKKPSEKDAPKAVNYWWGLSAGVVDLCYSPDIPAQVTRLVKLVERDMAEGRFQPFAGRLTAQGGRVIQSDGILSPEEILRMDWLAENVVGQIPAVSELTEEAQALAAIQGVPAE